MSSTNRGNRGGGGADFFATPSWCVRRLLERVTLPGGVWLEPCAGDGAIVRAVNAVRGDVTWLGCELREECRASLPDNFIIGDFLSSTVDVSAMVILTNPPFSLAEAFVRKCFDMSPWVVMLLRLNFLGSQQRYRWLHFYMPDVYVFPQRPSFTGNGTDSIEYAWFVWPPDRGGRTAGRLELLDTTPLHERKAG